MPEQDCTDMPLTVEARNLLEELRTDIREQAASGQLAEIESSIQRFGQASGMHPEGGMNQYRDTVYQDRYQDTAYDDHYKDNVGYRDAAR